MSDITNELANWVLRINTVCNERDAEIERLTAENRFLFDVIKNDPLLVERYNAFNERRALEDKT